MDTVWIVPAHREGLSYRVLYVAIVPRRSGHCGILASHFLHEMSTHTKAPASIRRGKDNNLLAQAKKNCNYFVLFVTSYTFSKNTSHHAETAVNITLGTNISQVLQRNTYYRTTNTRQLCITPLHRTNIYLKLTT